MTLVDTLNGHLMIGAYGWAQAQPERKILYNLTITTISVLTAVAIGTVEIISLAGNKLHLEGLIIDAVESVSEHFSWFGYGIIFLCLLSWTVSFCLSRAKRQSKML